MRTIALKGNEVYTTLEIVFEHPDYNSEYHTEILIEDAYEETDHITLAKLMWDKYNRYGFYHTMKITQSWYFDGHWIFDPDTEEPIERIVKTIYNDSNPHYA